MLNDNISAPTYTYTVGYPGHHLTFFHNYFCSHKSITPRLSLIPLSFYGVVWSAGKSYNIQFWWQLGYSSIKIHCIWYDAINIYGHKYVSVSSVWVVSAIPWWKSVTWRWEGTRPCIHLYFLFKCVCPSVNPKDEWLLHTFSTWTACLLGHLLRLKYTKENHFRLIRKLDRQYFDYNVVTNTFTFHTVFPPNTFFIFWYYMGTFCILVLEVHW